MAVAIMETDGPAVTRPYRPRLRQRGEREQCLHVLYRRTLRAVLALVAAALALLSVAAPSSAGPQPRVYLSPVMTSVDYDRGRFSIFVPVSDLDHRGRITYDDDRDTVPDREQPSIGVGAFELLFHFDPDVVRVEAADPGPFIESSGRVAQCFDRQPERGQYALACVTTGSGDGAQGSGTLATVMLRPVANGTSFLALDAQLSGPLGDSIPMRANGGVVEVRGGPESPPDGDSGSPDGPRPVDGPDGTGNGTSGNTPGGSSTGGTNGNGGSDSGDSSNDPADPGAPTAGTGYRPFENPGLTIAGLLALAGGVLLLVWSRVVAKT